MFAEHAPAGTLRYSLRLSRQTPSNNSIKAMHYRVYQKERRAWKQRVLDALGGVLPATPIAKSRLVFIRHSQGALDWDNCFGGLKPLMDCLVSASARNPDGLGLIANDDPISVPFAPTMRQEKAKRGAGYTEIHIYEL